VHVAFRKDTVDESQSMVDARAKIAMRRPTRSRRIVWNMWDLKDAGGAAVPPGGYKLQIETHSSGGVTLVTVPFDTSKAVVFEMAAPAGEVRSAAISCL
jgi:hypothetical protein